MNENEPTLTRGDLIKGGLAGLTLLAIGCGRPQVETKAPKPIDKSLLGYREVHSIAVPLHWARGLTLEGSSFWVAGDMALVRLDPTGNVEEKIDLPANANAISVAPDGALFAATNDQVVIRQNGKAAGWPSLGPRARLVSVLATETEVFAADAGQRVIHRYDRKGHLLNRIGEKSGDYVGLIVPSPYLGFGLSPTGDLIVGNPGQHRVERHSVNGKLLSFFGMPSQEIDGFCGCCNPSNLIVAKDGRILTAEKGLPRVKVLTPEGKLAKVVAGPDQFDPLTAGLDLAILGNKVFVLDPHRASIRVFEPIA